MYERQGQVNSAAIGGFLGGSQIGAAAGDSAMKRQPEIHREMEAMDKAIAVLQTEVDCMLERLGPIRHQAPQTASGGLGDAPVGTALGGRLFALRNSIDSAAMRLRMARDELEI